MLICLKIWNDHDCKIEETSKNIKYLIEENYPKVKKSSKNI